MNMVIALGTGLGMRIRTRARTGLAEMEMKTGTKATTTTGAGIRIGTRIKAEIKIGTDTGTGAGIGIEIGIEIGVEIENVTEKEIRIEISIAKGTEGDLRKEERTLVELSLHLDLVLLHHPQLRQLVFAVALGLCHMETLHFLDRSMRTGEVPAIMLEAPLHVQPLPMKGMGENETTHLTHSVAAMIVHARNGYLEGVAIQT